MSNEKFLHEIIVDGRYGRKIAYADVETITDENVVTVLGNCLSTFFLNRTISEYLWNYYKGDQPILYREKTIRDDIINKVVENHAFEIVQFKVGQTYGEPIQLISLTDDKAINLAVEKFNSYMRASNKAARDITCGEWQSATGVGFKALQKTHKKELPTRIVVPTPLNTFIIRSSYTEEPLMSVQQRKDEDGNQFFECFTDTRFYKIQNGKVVIASLHGFGGIPVVEYPNNSERLSDIELVITMLDAINNMQSNRMDAVEQFVQSWVKFVNCDIDSEQFELMRAMGALAVNSTDNKKADVDIMSQELKQSESQVAKSDLWDNVLTISAIPNKQGNGSGDTQGAVELRNGWDFSKQRARLKDPFVIESERAFTKLCLETIRVDGNNDCRLGMFDYDVQINHSPTDNMQVKVQSLQMLLQAGIHPFIALRTCGLFDDVEKVFNESKPYLDALYKTIDEIEDAEEQQRKAEELLKKNEQPTE